MELEKFDPQNELREERWGAQGVIVMKGLPCTAKTEVAVQISRWAKCPVLSIDSYIGDHDIGGVGSSWEEAERLHACVLQQAFTTLCRAARFQLDVGGFKAVVIKSRLCSTFELQHLIQSFCRSSYGDRFRVLIVECVMRNKYQWQHVRFDKFYYHMRKWNRPRSWKDIEEVVVNHHEYDSGARAEWDRRLLELMGDNFARVLVRRLVLDPYKDLGISIRRSWEGDFNPILAHAINFLLTAPLDHPLINYQNPYSVEFDKIRRSRAKQFLDAPIILSTRAKTFCGEGRGGCLFKLCSKEKDVEGLEDDSCWCELCEEKVVVSGGEAAYYACHFCILTLHQSCVDNIHVNTFLNDLVKYDSHFYYFLKSPGDKYGCKAHCPAFRLPCTACRFQTLVKRRLVAPVVWHDDHHPHPLSLIVNWDIPFVCKACGVTSYFIGYVCKACEWYSHVQCISMPREWEHGHAGHEHTLELKHSQDDMGREDYWCDVCYEDLDPYLWYYSCTTCPYYAAHLYCASVHPRKLWTDNY